MRFLLATVTIAILKVITASADDDNTIFKQIGSLQYVDNFLSPEESKHFYDTMESLSRVHPFDPTAKSLGNVMVSSLIQRRLKDAVGTECLDEDMIDTNGGIMLQTRIINKSTKPHIDFEAEGKVVENDVMFITLNSNPEAHFNHGGNSLPAMAGRLVRFAGSAVHGTTLNSGDPIRLLGPFSIKNFASVGVPTLPCSDCSPPDGYCISGGSNIVDVFEGGEECYEKDGTGTGDCPSDTGLCINVFEGGEIAQVDSIGDGTPCSGSACYECTNRAGTCPPATTSTMATTTQASTSTTETTTTSETSTTVATTTQATTSTTTTSTVGKGEELKELLKALITAIIFYFYKHKDSYDGVKLEEVMKALKDEGGIRGRRVLEDEEDIKTLLISLLDDEKMDEY